MAIFGSVLGTVIRVLGALGQQPDDTPSMPHPAPEPEERRSLSSEQCTVEAQEP